MARHVSQPPFLVQRGERQQEGIVATICGNISLLHIPGYPEIYSPFRLHQELGCRTAIGVLSSNISSSTVEIRWMYQRKNAFVSICIMCDHLCMAELQSGRQEPVANDCKAWQCHGHSLGKLRSSWGMAIQFHRDLPSGKFPWTLPWLW